jgi:hypothetical protein
MEWVNPKYADLVASMRTAEIAIDGDEDAPLRAFIVPDADTDD